MVKVKIGGLYNMGRLTCSNGFDYGGIWEARGARGLDTKRPEFHMVRVASFSDRQLLGVEKWMPHFLIEHYAGKVDRTALGGVPIDTNKNL